MTDNPPSRRIDTSEDGPFIVHGGVPIRTADYVYSENDEPMTWKFGEELGSSDSAQDEPVALCRCGQSGNRPFCDGSHESADWDSTDAAVPEEPYEERARRKSGGGGTSYEMLDDTPLCMHAGLCGTAKQTVWQMMPATDDSETLGTVMRMVEKCPSGRLTNVVDGRAVEPSLPTEINVVPGGPLWVTGGLAVENASGTKLEQRNRVTLCRCGASSNKPLCDGSHADIGFEDAD